MGEAEQPSSHATTSILLVAWFHASWLLKVTNKQSSQHTPFLRHVGQLDACIQRTVVKPPDLEVGARCSSSFKA